MDAPHHTVVETPAYLASAKGLLSDEDRSAIADMIAADPTCGEPTESDMRKEAFDQLMAGMGEALAYAQGDKGACVERTIPFVDVAAIRKATGLSQAKFAATFGLDKSAVEEWEQGRRKPGRAARVLLRVIEINPQVAQEAARSA